MTAETRIPSTTIVEVARMTANPNACAYSAWFRSRYPIIPTTNDGGRGPIERDPRCTALAHKTASRLEEHGDTVYHSLRNSIEAWGSRTGARLKGRPDMIARSQDGMVTV